MPEEKINSRDRPIENSDNIENSSEHSYEFNSFWSSSALSGIDDIFGCSISSYFSPEEIRMILSDPITNHEAARKLAMFVYSTDGVVSNSIDYMVSIPCLDRVVYGKKRLFHKKKFEQNKNLMLSVLDSINDKAFMRDALFTDMNEGTCFYYLETTVKPVDKKKFLTDYEVENIVELCDLGVNAVLMPLPYCYCKIVGRKNGRYVVAFNLRYFDEQCTNENKIQKLKQYPSEISKAYNAWATGQRQSSNWIILNNDHTIAHKIKCKISEPWGRPLAIAAISDILYQGEFVDTKRNTLTELNNKIIYETFPEGKEKGSCALTKGQQEDQHAKIKQAVMEKNNRGGTSFFSVAAGTKLDTLDVSVSDIFDSKNESNLTDKIALDLGIASSLLNGSSTGNYSAQINNLELINAQIYAWVQELQAELNYVINACIIKDNKNKVEVYYLPTSLVNRKNLFDMMKSLYLEASGSLTFLIASTGINPEVYFSVLDEEIENDIFSKYVPHETAYIQSNNGGGRPENENVTNENTIQSKSNNSNNQPKPSTK